MPNLHRLHAMRTDFRMVRSSVRFLRTSMVPLWCVSLSTEFFLLCAISLRLLNCYNLPHAPFRTRQMSSETISYALVYIDLTKDNSSTKPRHASSSLVSKKTKHWEGNHGQFLIWKLIWTVKSAGNKTSFDSDMQLLSVGTMIFFRGGGGGGSLGYVFLSSFHVFEQMDVLVQMELLPFLRLSQARNIQQRCWKVYKRLKLTEAVGGKE